MLTTRTKVRDYTINDLEARRIRRHFAKLGERLAGWPDPVATLLLTGNAARSQVTARLRVRLGHLGGHLVGQAAAETADHAVRLASEQIRRQLERRIAQPAARAPEQDVDDIDIADIDETPDAKLPEFAAKADITAASSAPSLPSHLSHGK